MKTTKRLMAFALIAISMCTSYSTRAAKAVNLKAITYYSNPVSDDPNMVINVIKNSSEINVHISYNGNEGTQGKLKIYNASNQLVIQFDIELKSSPNYASVLLNEFAEGSYTCELVTNNGVHVSHINI